ncbi:hypothetical protein NC652_034811 [Populus alba x Populus x berolinensis]|nr:hypothetical protein NC652_034811 [Populus alba x Populus x berolinensis]
MKHEVNQVGTVTGSIRAAFDSKAAGWGVMIKTGAPCRSERLAKYNQNLDNTQTSLSHTRRRPHWYQERAEKAELLRLVMKWCGEGGVLASVVDEKMGEGESWGLVCCMKM